MTTEIKLALGQRRHTHDASVASEASEQTDFLQCERSEAFWELAVSLTPPHAAGTFPRTPFFPQNRVKYDTQTQCQ